MAKITIIEAGIIQYMGGGSDGSGSAGPQGPIGNTGLTGGLIFDPNTRSNPHF